MIRLNSQYRKSSLTALINSNISCAYMDKYLSKLFKHKQFVLDLSNYTKIYPQFFSQHLLKKFTRSKDIQVYENYAENRFKKLKKLTNGEHLNKLFKKHPIYFNSIPILQCYINWINRTKLKNPQFFFNNKIAMEIFHLSDPIKWFPNMPGRQFIYHHGPTNSGKTSAALADLKNLDKSKKGIYMAPLRLLAWEMQQKLGNCNLITGQDKDFRISNLTSCTIQTFNQNQQFDIAIIDEIQMIGDSTRGWAWTKAVLGLKSKRIHLCGDQRALNLISKLVKATGGSLEERRYSRLSKLKLIHKKFQLKNIQPGDCLIKFSIKQLILLRNQINKLKYQQNLQQHNLVGQVSNKQNQPISPTAIVYGKLPSQCRKIQANNFNNQISPYIVATNAIGMGLNLKIKKIIFMSITRKDRYSEDKQLQQHQIQQIAGRAGRGQFDGYVQCADQQIFKKVRKALKNVNKSYGINLIDQKAQIDTQKSIDEEDMERLFQSNSQTNEFLKRALSKNQKKIQNAGLFVHLSFIKRVKIQLQYLFQKQISLFQVFEYLFKLSTFQQKLYGFVSKNQFLEIIHILQPFNLQIQDYFQLAEGLSMKSLNLWTKKIIYSYAKQFKQKCKVEIPSRDIRTRNQLNDTDQSLNLKRLQQNYSVLEIYVYLWNKYEFAFWDIEQAKLLKQQIVQKMKSILQKRQPFEQNKIEINKPYKSKRTQNQFDINQRFIQKYNKKDTNFEVQKSFHRNSLKSNGADQKLKIFYHKLEHHQLYLNGIKQQIEQNKQQKNRYKINRINRKSMSRHKIMDLKKYKIKINIQKRFWKIKTTNK